MSAPVFVNPAAVDARPGDVLVVEGAEGRHASQALRLAVGEAVHVVEVELRDVNGGGGSHVGVEQFHPVLARSVVPHLVDHDIHAHSGTARIVGMGVFPMRVYAV